MRKLILAPLITVIIILSIESRMRTELAKAPTKFNQKESSASALTPAEEEDLRRLTNQVLPWILLWRPTSNGCLRDGEIVVIDIPEEYKRHEGKEIEATLVIREQGLSIFLPALHTRLGFMRLHDAGLGPPTIEFFCENSYEEYVAARKQMADQTREIGEEIMRRVENDPEMAKIIEEMRKKEAERPKDKVERIEVRSYQVPSFVEQPVEGLESWSEQKKQLYERIIAVVNKEVEEAYCESGNITKVTVPDFNIGDPSIYILIEMSPSRNAFKSEAYIEWIEFDRDLQSGEYGAHHVKTISRVDDLKRFRSLIEQRKIEELNILCPRKSIR